MTKFRQLFTKLILTLLGGVSGLIFSSRYRLRLPWQRLVTTAAILAILVQMVLPFSHLSIAPVVYAADFTPTRFDDPVPDASCPGDCSLREAIIAANASGTADRILLPEGTYTLTQAGAGNANPAQGDLDITGAQTLEIIGQGNGAIIDGGAIDRVFHVNPGAGNVTMTNLTIQNGTAQGGGLNDRGGGIYLDGLTNLILTDVTVTGNTATSFGGGINNLGGTLTMNRVTISGNTSTIGSGGAIRNEEDFGGNAGNVVGTNVTMSGNIAAGGGGTGGAIVNTDTAQMTLTHATIVSNTAQAAVVANGGAAVRNSGTATLTFNNSIIANPIGPAGVINCSIGGGAINGNNNVEDAATCTFAPGDSNQTPLISPLANNGGRTQTHALVASTTNSAIDKIAGAAFCTINEDQRGSVRPFEIPGVNTNGATAACDAGAYELSGIPDITVNSPSQQELNPPPATNNMTFVLTLSTLPIAPVQVTVATSNNTATQPGDYTALAPTVVNFPLGTISQTVMVPIVADVTPETPASETFFLNLAGNVFANLPSNQTSGTIIDDDNPSAIQILNATAVTEGNAGTTPMVFTVVMTPAQGAIVAVQADTADGTATLADSDYVQVTGQAITFNPGETSKTVTVQINGDTNTEADETVLVNLSNVTGNATISDPQGQGVITNDDTVAGTPTVSIVPNASVIEGNSGTVNLDFPVSLSAASTSLATVNYAITDGTARSGEDYNVAPTSGTLSFAPGTTVQTISVPIVGETVAEVDETFTIALSAPTGATLGTASSTGTITNDDGPAPTLSIGDAVSIEGDAGTVTMNFPVTLSAASTGQVTVDYTTNDGTATGLATTTDFGRTTGTLTFNAGETTKSVPVTINGDTAAEGDETFTVTLSNPRNATIAAGTGTGTITNDDQGATGPTDRVPGSENDDDDDGGSSAAPPPPASAPAAPAAPTQAPAPTAAPAQEELPVTTLPATGVDGSSATPFPWLTVLALGLVGAAVLVWDGRRRRKNRAVATSQPDQTLSKLLEQPEKKNEPLNKA